MWLSRSTCRTGRTYQIPVALGTISCSLFLETVGSQDNTNPPIFPPTSRLLILTLLCRLISPASYEECRIAWFVGFTSVYTCRLGDLLATSIALNIICILSTSTLIHLVQPSILDFGFTVLHISARVEQGTWKLVFSALNPWALPPKSPPAAVFHISTNSNSVFQLHGQNSRIRQNDMWVAKREVKKQTKRKFLLVILNFA